tara:strand:- start:526 stop:807 length:282 start_codon:yes stop_codon:yes gene_type:complete
MQLSHATSELENIITLFGKGVDKEKVEKKVKSAGSGVLHVLQQTGTLVVNVSIGALYGIGTTSFLMFVYPFKLFYRRVFKRQVEIASKKKIKV